MSKKKKILVFIDWYLPGFKAGGPIRSCANLVSEFGDEFDFLVVTRDTDYTSSVPYPGVKSDEWNTGSFGEKIYYFSEAQLNRKNLRKLIRETDFDVAYINGIYSWWFSLVPLILCRKNNAKKIVVATRGMLAKSAIAVKGVKKKLFLNMARFSGIYKNVLFHATNETEQNDILREISSGAKVVVADNLPPKRAIPESRNSTKVKGVLQLISIARISPEKNLLYALECLKKCDSGTIIFNVFGPVYDVEYFKQCEQLVAGLPSSVKVNFHEGIQPEMIMEKLSEHDLFFMPSRGENFGHVILESMMAGTPVLISDQTPWKNLNVLGSGLDLPLDDQVLYSNVINRFVEMDASEHQQFINAALTQARIKNDTSLEQERYRLLFS